MAHRVGWGFMSVYTLAFMRTNLVFLTPLLVTLPLRVDSLVGIKQAPSSLGTCRRDRRPGGHSIAPAGAPAILAIGSGNYGVLYAVAGIFAIIGAVAILPVRGVR